MPVELNRLALGRTASEDRTTENASDVRIREWSRVSMREARDRGRGVWADAREGVEPGDIARQTTRAPPRDELQIAGAPVVTEARPLPQHVAQGCTCEGTQRWEAPQESRIRGYDPGDLRLLQHDFADEDAIGILSAPPGKIATRAPVPREDSPAERRREGAFDVQFGAQNSTPG